MMSMMLTWSPPNIRRSWLLENHTRPMIVTAWYVRGSAAETGRSNAR